MNYFSNVRVFRLILIFNIWKLSKNSFGFILYQKSYYFKEKEFISTVMFYIFFTLSREIFNESYYYSILRLILRYLPVEIFSESTTHAVESYRIDAAVGESQAET